MALTYTPEVELGQTMPSFSLKSTQGESFLSESVSAKGLLVMFICNHCPYVQAIENRLIELGKTFSNSELKVVGICSNDPTDYPEDSFENLKLRAEKMNYTFTYLHDPSQTVAKKFGAVCTPDFFLFRQTQGSYSLYYRGRLDDSWKNPDNVKNEELKIAIELLLKGNEPPINQNPSMGCSIKWIN